jgi:hypothetical protein
MLNDAVACCGGPPDPSLRGGNFLEQFDVLIDYPHTILYLDNAKVMQPQIKGNTSRW